MGRDLDDHLHAAASPARARSSTASADVRRRPSTARRSTRRPPSGGRIPLPDLAADNVLVVAHAQPDTGTGTGILRTVDPSDKLVYVWTSFEPDDARCAFACFDQPDLKAPHGFIVDAHETWTVTSNCAPDLGRGPPRRRPARGRSPTPRRSRRTSSSSTPGRSTSSASERGGHSLGCTAASRCSSTSSATPRSCSTSPTAGLAFFGERFGQPFPQERYDQVFVPNMGGAMENWGCVTWTDSVLYRSTPTHGQRAVVAAVLLHEMAHMWFGDLVTMRWWDDLWLNEAFASWASTWAGVNAPSSPTTGRRSWPAASSPATGSDMGPATHPIRGDVPDVPQAMANFDAITYVKGESVLKQLVAYVGEDALRRGAARLLPRARLGQHPARRPDVGDRRRRRPRPDAAGPRPGSTAPAPTPCRCAGGDVLAHRPATARSRAPHRLDIGSYRRDGDGLEPVGTDARRDRGPAHAGRGPARRRPAPAQRTAT